MKYSLTRTGFNDQDGKHNPVFAIKAVRSLFGFSLREAKDLIDATRNKATAPYVFEYNNPVLLDHFSSSAMNLMECGYKLLAITADESVKIKVSLEQNAKLAIDIGMLELASDLLKIRQIYFK